MIWKTCMWISKDRRKILEVSRDNPQHKYRIVGMDCSAIRVGVRGIITWKGPGTPVKHWNSQLSTAEEWEHHGQPCEGISLCWGAQHPQDMVQQGHSSWKVLWGITRFQPNRWEVRKHDIVLAEQISALTRPRDGWGGQAHLRLRAVGSLAAPWWDKGVEATRDVCPKMASHSPGIPSHKISQRIGA